MNKASKNFIASSRLDGINISPSDMEGNLEDVIAKYKQTPQYQKDKKEFLDAVKNDESVLERILEIDPREK